MPPSRGHISEHDLERYYLGMIQDEEELASLEEHLLGCETCVDSALRSDNYVDAMRRGLLQLNNDLPAARKTNKAVRKSDA